MKTSSRTKTTRKGADARTRSWRASPRKAEPRRVDVKRGADRTPLVGRALRRVVVRGSRTHAAAAAKVAHKVEVVRLLPVGRPSVGHAGARHAVRDEHARHVGDRPRRAERLLEEEARQGGEGGQRGLLEEIRDQLAHRGGLDRPRRRRQRPQPFIERQPRQAVMELESAHDVRHVRRAQVRVKAALAEALEPLLEALAAAAAAAAATARGARGGERKDGRHAS